MNLVGKIFVVLIFVMSLVFMAFAMAVYATHRNWREVVILPPESPLLAQGKEVGLKFQLLELKKINDELRSQIETLNKDIATEREAKVQSLTKLETERRELLKERRDLEAGYAAEEKEKRDSVAAMIATQKNATDYRKELEEKRVQLIQAQQDRDEHFKEVVRLTDDLHQTVNEKELLRKRAEDVARDLAKYKELALWLDAPSPDSDYKSTTPPRVDAVVLAVKDGGLVEISIGSDAGLKKGHRLEIYRISAGSSVYVGRVEVVQTSPARSVCKIDPKFQNSHVMEGDRVDTKID